MGRVSKYKKVKSFDKYHKSNQTTQEVRESAYVWGAENGRKAKKRSATALALRRKKLKRNGGVKSDDGEFDLPPLKDDFDLSDLMGSVKKDKKIKLDSGLRTSSGASAPHAVSKTVSLPSQDEHNEVDKPKAVVTSNKVNIGGSVVNCTIPETDREERKMARLLNINSKTGKSGSKGNSLKDERTIEGRREGESMNAFERRLREETRLVLEKDLKSGGNKNSNPEKRMKKKEFLKQKKIKKKGGKRGYQGTAYERDDNDNGALSDDEESGGGFITGEQAAARASFLEQAERPPIFNQLPRGAHNKLKFKMRNTGEGVDKCKDKKKAASGLDEKKIAAEQNSMEVMRRKVQAQYALVKARRRQEGGFHL